MQLMYNMSCDYNCLYSWEQQLVILYFWPWISNIIWYYRTVCTRTCAVWTWQSSKGRSSPVNHGQANPTQARSPLAHKVEEAWARRDRRRYGHERRLRQDVGHRSPYDPPIRQVSVRLAPPGCWCCAFRRLRRRANLHGWLGVCADLTWTKLNL